MPRWYLLAAGVLLLLYTIALVRTAWLNDDAHITFRSCWNLVNGYGMGWNADERVQAFTHPLWMLVVSIAYFVTGEFAVTVMLLSMLISMIAVGGAVFGFSRNCFWCLGGLCCLILSSSFVDFSTSGLENSLGFLLFLLLFLCIVSELRCRRYFVVLLFSMLLLTRMDFLLLAGPVVGGLIWSERREWRGWILPALIGGLPFVAWELFSLIYFGTPFPNTAYAKLGVERTRWEFVQRGLMYLVVSTKNDPLPVMLIVGSLVVALVSDWWRHLPAAVGILVYLAYVVSIGGDFMSGRFLTVPMFVAFLILVRVEGTPNRVLPAALAFLAFVGGLLTGPLPFLSGSSYGYDPTERQAELPEHGIISEREYYYQQFNLWSALRGGEAFSDYEVLATKAPPHTMLMGAVGYYGLIAGPNAHVVDFMGLANATTGRMPPLREKNWRPGHNMRVLPSGYLEAITLGDLSRIALQEAADLQRQVDQIVRGPLLEGERLALIPSFAFGELVEWEDPLYFTHPSNERLEEFRDDWSRVFVDGDLFAYEPPTLGEESRDHWIPIRQWGSLMVLFREARHEPVLELSLDQRTGWTVSLMRGSEVVTATTLEKSGAGSGEKALSLVRLPLDPKAVERGFDCVLFKPIVTEGIDPRILTTLYVGHARLLPVVR